MQILGNKSLKIKYLNPNTVFIATGPTPGILSEDLDSANIRLTVQIVDTVTGAPIHRQVHKVPQLCPTCTPSVLLCSPAPQKQGCKQEWDEGLISHILSDISNATYPRRPAPNVYRQARSVRMRHVRMCHVPRTHVRMCHVCMCHVRMCHICMYSCTHVPLTRPVLVCRHPPMSARHCRTGTA